MARKSSTKQIRRRSERPVVLVDLHGFSIDWVKLVELSGELDWELLDPRYGGDVSHLPAPKGAIVHHLPTAPEVKRLLKAGCKVVRIGSSPHPKDHLVPAVMHDQKGCGRLAAEHFAERGFEHVGYAGFKPWSAKRDLYEGMKERASGLGLKVHLFRWRSGSFSSHVERYAIRQKIFAEWLETVPKPLGLLTFVDGHAAMLCRMCADAHVFVPDEVAVLGCENLLPASEGSRPKLSSIELDEDAKIVAAVGALKNLMAGEALESTTIQIPPKRVVVRESTDILAVSDLEVARALRFMWDNLAADITVDDVAKEIGVSRRHLARKFRSALDRSVNEELRRKRLQEARNLLRNTDRPVTEITHLVGFHSKQYLHRAFHRTFGITPLQYRKGDRHKT